MTEVENWQQVLLRRMLEGEVGYRKEEKSPRRVELGPYTKSKITVIGKRSYKRAAHHRNLPVKLHSCHHGKFDLQGS